MLKTFGLRARIYVILTAMVLITVAGGIVLVFYTYRMQSLLTSITQKNLVAFEAAESLETALVNQKGFVSYYFLDGDPKWLRQLDEYRRIFKARSDEVHSLATSDQEREVISRIAAEYHQYISKKDQVIGLYKSGQRKEGAILHVEVRRHFFSVLELCETFKNLQKAKIQKQRLDSHRDAASLRLIAGAAMFISCLLAILLSLVLIGQILVPIRKLAAAAERKEEASRPENEVTALSRSVHGLLDDVDQTQTELKRSRESLLQAEKLALVGKLAAGMAHSIRNPFTSVKMRLFSLGRSLELSEIQKEDFEVISEEIRHIDTIVQNFLEFSRPPKLKMQQLSLSAVVDQAIQLLKYRLKAYEVTVTIERRQALPPVEADPEQMKEVLVNLIVNACEAMIKGGSIVVTEDVLSDPVLGMVAVVRVGDTGPGIPASIKEKVLQPFFTTKEEGTGLGLSIAARIVNDHHGRLNVESEEGAGTTFSITLPVMPEV